MKGFTEDKREHKYDHVCIWRLQYSVRSLCRKKKSKEIAETYVQNYM
jgi:hypothetical protein